MALPHTERAKARRPPNRERDLVDLNHELFVEFQQPGLSNFGANYIDRQQTVHIPSGTACEVDFLYCRVRNLVGA